ncbi:MAG: AI-2E family transporter [Candidatus Kryptoniota bacterium]
MTTTEDKSEEIISADKSAESQIFFFKHPGWVLLLIGSLALVVLGYSVRQVFSPIFAYIFFLLAVYPLRRDRYIRHLIFLATIVFGYWFTVEVAGAILPFIVSFIISFIFLPVVSALVKAKVPRLIAIAIVLVLLLGSIGTLVVVVMPMVFSQFQNFLNAIPTLVSEVRNSLNAVVARGFFVFTPENQGLQQGVISEISGRVEEIVRAIPNGILSFVGQVVYALTKMLNLVLVPFLSFYIMKDYDLIKHRVKMLFPKRYRQRASEIYIIIDKILGSYLRGALTVSLVNATVITSLMTIWGVKYPLMIGLISGLLDLIPYFGIIVSTTVAVLIALFGDNPGFQVAMVLVSFIGMNLTETTILYPKIIGSRIGVHPVVLILALFIFGYFLGFLGLLIAVPTTAIIIALRKYYELNFRVRE